MNFVKQSSRDTRPLLGAHQMNDACDHEVTPPLPACSNHEVLIP